MIEGCICSDDCTSLGLIMISAGFDLAPKREARRWAKLIGGSGRTLGVAAGGSG